ncbi:MAG: trehalose-6-phosphate synthase [Dehalococcoidia bacterium]|nr:trehalose-6-phosphate synthase [Dehalococcoidia bacterium]
MEWTKEMLQELVGVKLSDLPLVVVSNREPYVHTYIGDKVHCQVPVSGLTMAVDPVMRACGGTWVAHGSGSADLDVCDDNGRVMVPPQDPSYTLRRVWLSREEQEGYYLGFSNEGMWPLCHMVFNRPTFDTLHWNMYKKVNQRFAEVVLEEVGDRSAFVFIQDYHFTLLPRLLKERNPHIITAQFWHIPWPNPEVFGVCPWQEEILEGLLGNDLLGFHIRYHCDNFMGTVDKALECRIDYENSAITRSNKMTLVRPFPISVDFDQISQEAESEELQQEIERIRRYWGLTSEIVGLGIDRVDYTKGIPERLRALDRFLTKHPRYRGRLVFFQIGEPSRIHIRRYKELNSEVEDLVEEINWKYGNRDWRPVIRLREHNSPFTLAAFRRLAHFCIVSSLHDGMNLVAKEFVASKANREGVLILSRFTGAARELTDALLVNPYSTDEMADAIKRAIEMPRAEKVRRMTRMREVVADNSIYRWAGDIISTLTGIEPEGV